MRLLIAMVMAAVLFVPGVFAEGGQQPTQQFSKIYMEPFYRVTMNQNTNYTYTVVVNPPDKISGVRSAIVTLDAWINPTRTFNIWVNGIACRTPDYTITTTYASAGRAAPNFDCGNVINSSGTYTVTLRVSGGNIGASTVWLDLTYMNAPSGSLKVHGTEYISGDVAKMFLQFLDASNQPVTNSECFLSVWYPNDTVLLNNTLMSKLTNASEGIYYKNFNVPNVVGVYPASARCYRPLTFYNVVLKNNVTENWESNTFTGGVGWSTCPFGDLDCQNGWDYEDTVPLSTIILNSSASGPCYSGLYCAKMTGSYGFIERGVQFPDGTAFVNISYWYKFKGFQTNEHFDFYVFDGNWHLIDAHGLSANRTNNIWYKDAYYLDASEFELDGGTILLGWYATDDTPSTSDEFYVDNISIDVVAANISLSNETDYQILRGSGEVHVSNLYNQLSGAIGGNASNQMDILRQINVTTNNTAVVVSLIKNDTSLLAQMYSWLLSIFNWVGTDNDQNATTAITIPFDQSIIFVDAQYNMQQASSVVANVQKGGLAVTGATCAAKVFYPNMTQQVSGAMTYAGIDGLYTYAWTPVTYGSHYAQVNCSGGGLQGQVQASGSLGVSAPNTGVIMQSIG